MRNRWSTRRRSLIFLIVLGALVLIIAVPAYLATRSEPNCKNGFQDGDETGVDCGGSCTLLCTPEVLPMISRGDARLLRIATSTYEIVVLVENPNPNGVVKRAPYAFAVYSGTSRSPVKVFERETYVGRGSTFALFEGPFELPSSGPFRVVFEWGELVWEKSSEERSIIAAESANLILSEGAPPRLEARLINRSQKSVSNIEAVALLSDSSGNIVAAGKTFVESLSAGAATPIIFSWPGAFEREAVSIRIIPRPLPDRSYIR